MHPRSSAHRVDPAPEAGVSCPSIRELPLHSHTQIRKAILLVIIFGVIAWLAVVLSEDRAASSPLPPASRSAVISPARPVQAPGSSLEGVNDGLAPVIAARRAAEEAQRQADAAARRAAAARTAPRPSFTPPPVRSAASTRCPAEIVALIEKYWGRFGPDVVQWAIGIAWRESNCRPDVTSPSNCAGVFQTAVPLHAGLYASLGYDWHTAAWQAEPNIAVAAALYASSGPGPWRL